MLAENNVPVADRYLVIEGRLSEASFAAVRGGLPEEAKVAECVFSRYTYADLSLPKRFDIAFDYPELRTVEHVSIAIAAATQQFSIPDNTLPHGWKMVCWLGRNGDVFRLLADLPIVDGWYASSRAVALATRETWAGIREASLAAERDFAELLRGGMLPKEALRKLYVQNGVGFMHLSSLATSSLRISMDEAVKLVVREIMRE